jgi:hypothetical protein
MIAAGQVYEGRSLKKILCTLSIIAMLAGGLPGCSGSRPANPDSYVFGQDSQYGYTDFATESTIAQAEGGYYFISGPNNGFLYFYDKSKKQAVAVCNKPDCLHDNEPDSVRIGKCNAYLCSGAYCLNYYQNQLYYLDSGTRQKGGKYEHYMTLNVISADGTKRREIYDFKDEVRIMQIHRGYAYFSTTDSATVAGQEAETKTTCKICRLQLDKPGAEPEVIDEIKEIYSNIGKILCYGNSVYFFTTYVTDMSMGTEEGSIRRYDIQSGDISETTDVLTALFTVFNGKFVYSPGKGKGTYACGPDGGEPVRISDESGILSANGEYLFIDNWAEAHFEGKERTLLVIDKNWKTIKTIPLAVEGQEITDPLGCSGEYYFLMGHGQSNEYGEIATLYGIALDKIPGDAKPEVLASIVPKVPFNGVFTPYN